MPPTPISKAERLLDLVIALLNAPRHRTAAWIRAHVAGYDAAPTDDAFARMFERDKQELRDLGIPIETRPDGDGYRIMPGEFAMPPIELTAADRSVLAVASRLWDTTVLADAGPSALRKLRDAAGGDDGGDGDDDVEDGENHDDVPGVHARLRTAEPAFESVFDALRARRALRFDYRRAGEESTRNRTVEPWGLVSYRGWWYLVGRDRDRDAPRTFRLSRIVSDVRAFGKAGAVAVPADINAGSGRLQEFVRAAAEPEPRGHALLRLRAGRCAGLRREAATLADAPGPDGFDEVRLTFARVGDLARRVAAAGPDAVAVEPQELVDAVIRLLRGAKESR